MNSGFRSATWEGVSGDHWFGVEPQYGRDLYAMLLYGMRTSLYMALGITVLIMVTGVVIGLIGGTSAVVRTTGSAAAPTSSSPSRNSCSSSPSCPW